MQTTTQVQERILTGAESLFTRFGIKNVTMDDIARHLGVSKKTIYQFFEDKDMLVSVLTRELTACHLRHLEEMATISRNAIDEILHIMQYMSGFFAKTNPSMFYDLQRYHPEGWKEFRKFKDKHVFDFVVRNMEKGREQGLYRQDFSIRILAKLRIEQVELVMNPEIFPADKFNLNEVQLQLLDHFLHGICTLKGHKLLNKHKQIQEDEA